MTNKPEVTIEEARAAHEKAKADHEEQCRNAQASAERSARKGLRAHFAAQFIQGMLSNPDILPGLLGAAEKRGEKDPEKQVHTARISMVLHGIELADVLMRKLDTLEPAQ